MPTRASMSPTVTNRSNAGMTNATMYHINRLNATLDTRRPYSSAISNSTIRVTSLSRRPIGLTFPRSTPAAVTLRISSGSIGDYVVYALPYPAGTSFIVATQFANGSTAAVLSASHSVDALTAKNPYVYNASSQHLFVLVSEAYAVSARVDAAL